MHLYICSCPHNFDSMPLCFPHEVYLCNFAVDLCIFVFRLPAYILISPLIVRNNFFFKSSCLHELHQSIIHLMVMLHVLETPFLSANW